MYCTILIINCCKCDRTADIMTFKHYQEQLRINVPLEYNLRPNGNGRKTGKLLRAVLYISQSPKVVSIISLLIQLWLQLLNSP
jgi:hypothetical protein